MVEPPASQLYIRAKSPILNRLPSPENSCAITYFNDIGAKIKSKSIGNLPSFNGGVVPYLPESLIRTFFDVLEETVDSHYEREEGEHSKGCPRSWPDPRVGSRGYEDLTSQVENPWYKKHRASSL